MVITIFGKWPSWRGSVHPGLDGADTCRRIVGDLAPNLAIVGTPRTSVFTCGIAIVESFFALNRDDQREVLEPVRAKTQLPNAFARKGYVGRLDLATKLTTSNGLSENFLEFLETISPNWRPPALQEPHPPIAEGSLKPRRLRMGQD